MRGGFVVCKKVAMPAQLTSVGSVMSTLGINPNDNSQVALIQNLITQATQAICSWCHRSDFGLASYTRVLSGNNTPTLILPDIPVQGAILTGNVTQDSAVITGLPTSTVIVPNATNLFQYQSVMGVGIPQGAVIADASQLSNGQITLGVLQNGVLAPALATASGTAVPLSFGIALFKDDNALGGSAYGSFGIGTLLQEGADFYVDWSQGVGTTCESGLIYNASNYWYRPAQWMYGLVSSVPGIPIKNVKVTATAGYTSIPADVQWACELLIAGMRAARKFGSNVQSMSNDMSVSLGQGGKIDVGLFTPAVRSALAPYTLAPLPNE